MVFEIHCNRNQLNGKRHTSTIVQTNDAGYPVRKNKPLCLIIAKISLADN